MKTESAFDVEANLQNENESIEFVKMRLKKYGVTHSLDTFLTSIGGAWTLTPQNDNVYRYVIDRFYGDVVWFDRSWMASGTATWKVLNTGRESQTTWAVDYDQATDTITWICGNYSSAFHGVSNLDSPIQLRISVPEKKLMVVVRSNVALGGLRMLAGSNLSVQ